MNPNAAPSTTFRVSSITKMLGPAVMTVSQGTMTRDMPKMAAAPLPPWKFKKTGQLWPATTRGVVMNSAQSSTPISRGADTAKTPFPVSIIKTDSPAQAPIRR